MMKVKNHHYPMHPKLPPTCITHTPSSMIKMTTDIVETRDGKSVKYSTDEYFSKKK